MRARVPRRPAPGYALVMALLAVALTAVATLAPLRHERQAQQREREIELLWIGEQYRRAIAAYRLASPGSVPAYPAALADLLEDRRFPSPRRHLRRLYPDPMTGRADWTLLREQGAIVGVASRSTATPLKRAGFGGRQAGFNEAGQYAQWQFVADGSAAPAALPPRQGAPEPPAPPTAPAPPADAPPVPPERRTDCLQALSRQLNLCSLLPAEQAQPCRDRARLDLLRCLRGG